MLNEFKRIIVIGGGGFIGSHVCEELLQMGKEVIVFDNLSTGKEENVPKGSKFIKGDIKDLEQLKGVMNDNDIDLVFHEAANISTPRSVEEPLYDLRENVLGTFNALYAALKSNVKRFIYASSAAVYGEPKYVPLDEKHPTEPISPYGVSKLAGERYCVAFYKTYGLKTVSLRFFNVYGPGENLKTTLDEVILYLNKMLSNRPITIFGDGNQTRDFVYVKDIVRAQLLAAEKDEAISEVINVGTGIETSINELVKTIEEVTGHKAIINHAPLRNGEIKRSFGDISKAQKILGYKPKFRLKEGIQELMNSL
jgi:UDP-glucose 4-epimerase